MELQKSSNHRVKYIDIAKGIGIILVVIGHSLPSGHTLRLYIYSFHMPLFIMLSGMVIEDDIQKTSVIGAIKREVNLIMNYAVWSVIYILFDIVMSLSTNRLGLHRIVWNIYQTLTLYGISVLWFLSSIIIMKVVFRCVLSARKRRGIIVLIALFLTVSFIAPNLDSIRSILWIYYPCVTILRATQMFVFFVLGYHFKRIMKEWTLWQFALMFSGCLVAWLILMQAPQTVDVHYMLVGNPIISFMTFLTGSLFVVGISYLFSKVKFIDAFWIYLGKHSLFIMVTHEYFPIKPFIVTMLNKFNYASNSIYAVCIIFVLIEILICLILEPTITRVIKKMQFSVLNISEKFWKIIRN